MVYIWKPDWRTRRPRENISLSLYFVSLSGDKVLLNSAEFSETTWQSHENHNAITRKPVVNLWQPHSNHAKTTWQPFAKLISLLDTVVPGSSSDPSDCIPFPAKCNWHAPSEKKRFLGTRRPWNHLLSRLYYYRNCIYIYVGW